MADSAPHTIADTVRAIDTAFDAHARIALAFSGGRDSRVLLDLCEPYKNRITVLWVNTGKMLPHMEGFVRLATEGWKFEELKSDLTAYWEKSGLPASVIPTDHAIGGRGNPKLPLINPWSVCCAALRFSPITAWLSENPEITAMIVGQRDSDDGRFEPAQFNQRLPIPVIFPLWSWTDTDIENYLTENAIELPEQYGLGWADSGECWPCTHKVTDPRMKYMRAQYPDFAQFIETAARQVYETAIAAAQHELDGLTPAKPAKRLTRPAHVALGTDSR